ncbi:hypothetical protein ACTJJ0_12220 [Chitinophaga sp. 22321]|uniref:DUF302 domain-containing protein n=1 Tax=Chitinophaga hostae TaxID=2831022 RepID=A0ABS5IWK0_9BACT|nr:hypothetical protein [Chitinophaga hostae]MBS0027223.1 hypothetical protein [Chitinophaga hostae]
MKTFKFTIQNLLSRKGDKISAPMSPMLFAKEMASQRKEKFNRLARVWFEDETIHQVQEDGGYTGYDTLIIASQFANDLSLTLWVDEGTQGIPVALAFQSDKEVIITPAYSEAKYARKLSVSEIEEIFTYVFDNPSALDIQNETDHSTGETKDSL